MQLPISHTSSPIPTPTPTPTPSPIPTPTPFLISSPTPSLPPSSLRLRASAVHLALYSLALTLPAQAQIVPDHTLGTQVRRSGNTFTIQGGTTAGTNLFHSFEQFSILTGRTAHFQNGTNIQNIFSRVTGLSPSQIDGLIRANGAANLFLLNPNGILFGANASLDIGGSFTASTASSVVFADGAQFSTAPSTTAPLLTVSVPIGLGFGSQPRGTLTNQGTLTVRPGQSLTLMGGDVVSSGTLTAPGGTVQLLGTRVGLLDAARIDTSSATGGGTVRVGGDLQGRQSPASSASGAETDPVYSLFPTSTSPLPFLTARRTFIAPGATIAADALTGGNGGQVIVWADEVTGFYGNIRAQGGVEFGNGGFVEVSGRDHLLFRGTVNTRAVSGMDGSLLLDPVNIIIANGTGDGAGDGDTTFAGNNSGLAGAILSTPLSAIDDALPTTLFESELEGLSGNTNVVLQATNDIIVNDLADNELTFAPGVGSIRFTADADGDGLGSFVMQDSLSDTLRTHGRPLAITGANLVLGNINTVRSAIAPITTTTTIDLDAGGLITDLATNLFTFTVPGTGTIDDVNLRLAADHAATSDLTVALRSPTNTTVDLFTTGSVTGAGFQDTLFDDQATTAIGDGVAPFAGSFTPTGAGGLAVFNGESPTGTWTLSIADGVPGNEGIVYRPGEAPWAGAIGTQLLLTNTTPSDPSSGSVTLNASGSITTGDIITSSAIGNAGEVSFTAGGDITTRNISADASGTGNGGSVVFGANGTITANNVTSRSNGPLGSGGSIRMTSTTGSIGVGSLDSGTSGSGPGGTIALTSNGGSIAVARAVTSDALAGAGGAIAFSAGGSITTGNIISRAVPTASTVEGGVSLMANGDIRTNDIRASTIGLTSNADNIGVNNLSTATACDPPGSGCGASGRPSGTVTVRAAGSVSAASINTTSDWGIPGGVVGGDGGGVTVIAGGDLAVGGTPIEIGGTRGAISTFSVWRDAGAVQLEAGGNVTIAGISTGSAARSANDVTITSQAGAIAINGDVVAATDFSGRAGNVTLTAAGDVTTAQIDAYALVPNLDAALSGGGVQITSRNGAIASGTIRSAGTGNGGGVSLFAAGDIGVPTISTVSHSVNGSAISITSTDGTVRLDSSILNSEASGSNQGGDIAIAGRAVVLSNNAELHATTNGVGNAGNITVQTDALTLAQAGIRSNSSAQGNAGNVDIRTGVMTVTTGSQIESTSSGSGNAGTIVVQTAGALTMDNARISTNSGDGNGGTVIIRAGSVGLTTGSRIESSTTGAGSSGAILVQTNQLAADASRLLTTSSGTGQSGTVTIRGLTDALDNQISLSGSEISTGNNGAGSGGNLALLANTISLNRSTLNTSALGSAGGSNAGAVTIQTNQFEAIDSRLATSSAGTGNAGDVILNSRNGIDLSNTVVTTATESLSGPSFGNSGDIRFAASSLNLENSRLTANTSGFGAAGDIALQATNAISVVNSAIASAVNVDASGRGGQVAINTGILSLIDGGQIFTDATDSGAAGSMDINASIVNLGTASGLFARAGGTAQSGTVTLRPQDGGALTITFAPGSAISASSSSNQPAGTITLIAPETITVQGNGSISAEATGGAAAGRLNVNTREFTLRDGAQATVSNTSTGAAGTVVVNAETVRLANQARLTANTVAGIGGSIRLQGSGNEGLQRLQVLDSLISASTEQGTAGTVSVNAAGGVVELEGTLAPDGRGDRLGGLFARSTNGGNAGILDITADTLTLRNGTQATVSSTGIGQVGSLAIAANVITLEDQARLAATSDASPTGRDLTLSGVTTLDLRGGSEISTATRDGQSGQITVNLGEAPATSVLLEGSRLLTTASGSGNAGAMTINTRQLTLEGGASLSTSTQSGQSGPITLQNLREMDITDSQISAATVDGQAGNLSVLTAGGNADVTVSGSRLFVGATGTGTAGNLDINAQRLTLLDGAELSTANGSSLQGGNIRLQGLEALEIRNSQVTASTQTGQAGTVTVNARGGSVLVGGNTGRVLADATNGGNAGTVTLQTQELTVQNGAQISVSSTGMGRAGRLEVTAPEMTLRNGAGLVATTEANRDSNSTITLTVDTLQLSEGSEVAASTQDGQGGQILISNSENTAARVELSGRSRLSTEATGTGNAGGVSINTRQLTLGNRSILSTASQSGRGGDITLRGLDTLQVNRSQISASTRDGQAGNLRIGAARGTVQVSGSGSELSVGASDRGSAGALTMTTRQLTVEDDARLSAATNSGTGQDIILRGLDQLTLQNGQITAATQSGQAGNLQIDAPGGSVEVTGPRTRISAAATTGGNAGDVTVRTRQLTLRNGAQVTVNSTGTGNAGSLEVAAREIVLANRAQLTATTESSPEGSTLTLSNVNTLQLNDNSTISASTQDGQGGEITVNSNNNAASQIELAGGSDISTDADRNGNAGAIDVNTQRLTLSDRSTLSASTNTGSGGSITLDGLNSLEVDRSRIVASTRNGEAGQLIVNAPEGTVQVRGGNARLSVEATGSGAGGNLGIVTNDLTVETGAQVTASAQSGRAGTVEVTARNVTLQEQAQLTAENTSSAIGGTIRLRRLNTLGIFNSRISVSTGSGTAGNVAVNASDSIQIRGRFGEAQGAAGAGGILADARWGTAGNVTLRTGGELLLEDGAELSSTVRGRRGDGNAGDITVEADRLFLFSGATITSRNDGRGDAGTISILGNNFIARRNSEIAASSRRGGGGQIDITIADNLFLNNGSRITSSVFSGRNNGGIISIRADQFFAFEDSDILAIADSGAGGRITIEAPVFIADVFANVRPTSRNFDQFRGNGRVDISASSRFGTSGTVNTPDVSFLQNALTELSSNFSSPDQVVAGSCLARRNVEQGSFVVTGSGGLPTSPYEALSGHYSVTNVQPLANQDAIAPPSPATPPATQSWHMGDPIEEAQALMATADGGLWLGREHQGRAIADTQELTCGTGE